MRVLGMKKISVYVLIVMIMAIMGYFTYQYYKNKWAIEREKERQETAVRIKEMMQRSAIEARERQIAAQEAEKKKAEALIERRKKIAAGTAKTEKIITYHKNGNKFQEYELVEGIEEGLHQYWHENGDKSEAYYVVEGKKEGLYQSWYGKWINDKLECVVTYKAGKMHGEQKCYHNNYSREEPQPIKSITYYIDGVVKGKAQSWYPSGKPKSEGYYSDDPKENYGILWYEDGTKEYEERYDSEKAMRLIQYWYPSGVLSRQEYSKNGKRYGKVLYWYPSGAKKIEAEHSNDDLNGWCYMWNEQGELIRKGFYINDILDYDKPYLNEGDKKCWQGVNDIPNWP